MLGVNRRVYAQVMYTVKYVHVYCCLAEYQYRCMQCFVINMVLMMHKENDTPTYTQYFPLHLFIMVLRNIYSLMGEGL